MTYDLEWHNQDLLQSAWNSNSQTIQTVNLSAPSATTFDFTLSTIGLGAGSLTNSDTTLENVEGLKSFFIGDIRSNNTTNAYYNLFCIDYFYRDSGVDIARGRQNARYMFGDDQVYTVAGGARMRMTLSWRSGGATITPYVRSLGFLVKV